MKWLFRKKCQMLHFTYNNPLYRELLYGVTFTCFIVIVITPLLTSGGVEIKNTMILQPLLLFIDNK